MVGGVCVRAEASEFISQPIEAVLGIASATSSFMTPTDPNLTMPMNPAPTVSVVVPHYRDLERLDACLAALGCESAWKFGSDALLVQLGGQAAPISRASRRSSLARPYICRLTSLSLVTWPSV